MATIDGCLRAIDLSAAQGTVDAAALAGAGVTLAWVEVGVGNDRPNPCAAAQVAACLAAGLRVRPYCFAYPLPADGEHPARDPIGQVALWEAEAGGLGLDPQEPWAIDGEWPRAQDWGRWGVSAEYVRGWLLAALGEVERRTGVVPWLYASPAFLDVIGAADEPALARYPLWVADWTAAVPDAPPPWNSWSAWQWSNVGRVDGVEGAVDLSWVRP